MEDQGLNITDSVNSDQVQTMRVHVPKNCEVIVHGGGQSSPLGTESDVDLPLSVAMMLIQQGAVRT